MLLRNDQNPDSFFDAINKHLAPGRDWKRLIGEVDAVVFGSGFWKAEIHYKSIEGIDVFAGATLACDEYNPEDLEAIEYVIALLEGMEYAESSDLDIDEKKGA